MFHLSTSYIASNSPHFSWVEEEENNKMALGGRTECSTEIEEAFFTSQ